MPTPGILHVTSQSFPSPSSPSLPRGLHYRAADSKAPPFLDLYELSDITLASAEEIKLKPPPEQIERTTCALLFERGRGSGIATEPARFLIVLRRRFKAGLEESGPREYAQWFEEEHVGLIAQIPGWRRSRAFRSVPDEEEAHGHGRAVEYFTVHEYDFLEEMKATMGRTKGLSSEWKEKVDAMLAEKVVREWEFDGEVEGRGDVS